MPSELRMQLYKCKNALNQTVHITYILYGDQTVCDFCIKVCIWCLYFVFRYYVTDKYDDLLQLFGGQIQLSSDSSLYL